MSRGDLSEKTDEASEVSALPPQERLRRIAIELRKTRDRYRQLIENIGGYVIFTMDGQGTITSWNRGMERLLGYSEAEVIDQPFALIFTQEDRSKDAPAKEIAEASKSGEVIEDRWHSRKDGSRFCSNGMLTALRDPTGFLIGFSKVLRDLTTATDEGVGVRAAQITAELVRTVGLWQTESATRQRLELALLNAVDDERHRLGRELHDGLCQHLAGTAIFSGMLSERAAKIEPTFASDVGKITELLNEGLAHARTLARGLHPILIESGGLVVALRDLAERTTLVLPCDFECSQTIELSEGTALHLYRIAQEAVNNATKHAAPGKIVITLRGERGSLILTVTDDGKGIRGENPSGMGLHNMRDRARAVGGSLTIESSPEKGTVVTCVVPLIKAG